MLYQAKFWLKFSIFNLLIVALVGLLMRYKIAFEFPYLNQKSLQHAHSHFAFSGWVSHTLMVLMIYTLSKKLNANAFFAQKYVWLLAIHLLCAYGMLVFFTVQGYGFFSIVFSSLSVVVSYVFAFWFWRDSTKLMLGQPALPWFKAALLFNVISSVGTFALAYMMATKNIHQNEYLASIYYYLHFQYNGWFFFGCAGLLIEFLNLKTHQQKTYRQCFWALFISCIPAYGLSILWLDLPIFVYVIVVMAALVQTLAWLKLLQIVLATHKNKFTTLASHLRWVFGLVALALTVKMTLQLASVIPSVSQLAFGFRPIVIAYLHLVLLMIISLFLLTYIFAKDLLPNTSSMKKSFVVFVVGVVCNEIVLGIQGIASFSYTLIPFQNELLFVVALVMLFGLIGMVGSVSKK